MLKFNIPYRYRKSFHLRNEIWKPWMDFPFSRFTLESRRISAHCLSEYLSHALSLTGDVAEFGVYRGDSSWILAHFIQKHNKVKTLHLFDTFNGIPSANPDKDNYWMAGDFNNTSLSYVQDIMAEYNNCKYYEGLFENTIYQLDCDLCFAHIDSDTYTSVLFATKYVYQKLVPGGIIIFDDYGDAISLGARTAVDEFFTNKEKVIYLPSKQAVIIKSF